MADKNNANIGFEKQIWNAACVLWGHIPAAEYRQVISCEDSRILCFQGQQKTRT